MSTEAVAEHTPASSYKRLRERTFQILSVGREGDRLSRACNLFLIVLIISNTAAVLIETVGSVESRWGRQLELFETMSVVVFTIEYILRLGAAPADLRYLRPIEGRLRFAVSFPALIDLLAILPFYLAAVPLDLRTLRSLRLLRLVRTLKIGRYSESLQTLGRVFVAKREELMTTLLAGLVVLVVASTLIYYAEKDEQPEAFSSIPAAMWWAVATLTTVGYGDIYPRTGLGKLLGSIVAVLGIGLFALPAGILGSGFVELLQGKKRRAGAKCPHCGKDIPA